MRIVEIKTIGQKGREIEVDDATAMRMTQQLDVKSKTLFLGANMFNALLRIPKDQPIP